MSQHFRVLLSVCVLTLTALVLKPGSGAAQGFASATDAYRAGVRHLMNMDHPKAREALEQALQLAPDARLKREIYRALAVPYRGLAEMEPLLEALEYLIRHPGSPAERSLARSGIISHVRNRGKGKEAAQRYEAMLKKNPVDWTPLFILSALYSEVLQDAQRAATITERLIAVTKKQGDPVDPRATEQLARQYVKTGRWKEAAELFEKVAPLDKKLSAWNLKEAASAWLKAGEKDRAITAARASAEGPPEERSALLVHFWHRDLGDIFFETAQYPRAIDHYTRAIAKTDIEGYRSQCQRKLDEARKRNAK